MEENESLINAITLPQNHFEMYDSDLKKTFPTVESQSLFVEPHLFRLDSVVKRIAIYDFRFKIV